jgi:hypothetical protein
MIMVEKREALALVMTSSGSSDFSPPHVLVEKKRALACSDSDIFGDDVILKDQFLYTTLPDDNCGEERSSSIDDDVILKV